MTIEGWMQVLQVDGQVPQEWDLDDEAELRRLLDNVVLQGFPGGASLESSDGKRFRFQIVVDWSQYPDPGVLSRATDVVLTGLAELGVDPARCETQVIGCPPPADAP